MYCPDCNRTHQPLYCPHLTWPEEDMIDPISQPDRISTRIWDYSPRGYYSMRGRDEGKLVEAEMFWTSFDDVVWC